MPRRLIDTEVFNKKFMREIPVEYIAFWIYLFCRCDHAGIWEKDFKLASLMLNKKIDESKAFEYFNRNKIRVIDINGRDKWFIPGYIEEQYKKGLKPGNNAHDSCISILNKYNLIDSEYRISKDILAPNEPLIRPWPGDKEKEEEKEEEKEREKEEEKNARGPEEFLNYYIGLSNTADHEPGTKLWKNAIEKISSKTGKHSLINYFESEETFEKLKIIAYRWNEYHRLVDSKGLRKTEYSKYFFNNTFNKFLEKFDIFEDEASANEKLGYVNNYKIPEEGKPKTPANSATKGDTDFSDIYD